MSNIQLDQISLNSPSTQSLNVTLNNQTLSVFNRDENELVNCMGIVAPLIEIQDEIKQQFM